MISRICGDRPHHAIPLDRPGRHGVTSLWQSLAQLSVAGHGMDFDALWREFDLGPDPRTLPKPKMTVRISGTNYGKKYPPEGGAAGLPRPNPPRAQVAKRANGEVMETKERKSSGAAEANTNENVGNGGHESPRENGREGGAVMPRAPSFSASASARPADPRAHGLENGNGAAASTNGIAKGPHRETGPAAAPSSAAFVSRGPAPAWRQGESSGWLSAYEAIQCRTAEAHAVFQQTMAQCHLSFLRTAEQSALALASLAAGAPALPLAAPRGMALPASAEDPDAFAMTLPAIQWSPPAHPSPPVSRAPAPKAPPPPPSPIPIAVSDGGLATIAAPAAARAPAPVRPAAPAPAAAPTGMEAFRPPPTTVAFPADGDLKTFLFSVISEKTGYPVEILNLDQQLEADLGIDSIKRVEILSAFEGQIPDIKDVNLEEVASLSTLRDVVGFMERFSDQLGLSKKKS